MNLLIAIMGDSYEKVKETERVQALHERAKIIVAMELQYPSWHVCTRGICTSWWRRTSTAC